MISGGCFKILQKENQKKKNNNKKTNGKRSKCGKILITVICDSGYIESIMLFSTFVHI